MESQRSALSTNATASGAADAPALGTQGTGGKWTTGHQLHRLMPKTPINVAAWNVRTGHHVGQKEIIARELSKLNALITALSELWLTGSGTVAVEVPAMDEKMTLYYSGGDKREAGVGFMVHHRFSVSVVVFQPISDHIAILTVDGMINVHVIAAYAPTETNSDVSKDEFYDRLQDVLDSLLQTTMIMITGDMKGHVGIDRTGWESTMGKFGHGEMNDNGLRLMSFATANKLVLRNTLFQHSLKHHLTWRNPRGNDSALLNYMLINTQFQSSLQDVRAMRGPDCSSDHYLVHA